MVDKIIPYSNNLTFCDVPEQLSNVMSSKKDYVLFISSGRCIIAINEKEEFFSKNLSSEELIVVKKRFMHSNDLEKRSI